MKRIIYLIALVLISIIWERADLIRFPLILLIFLSMIYSFIKKRTVFKGFSEFSKTIMLVSYLLVSLASMIFVFSFGQLTNDIVKLTALLSLGMIIVLGIVTSLNKVRLEKEDRKKLFNNLYLDFSLIVLLTLVSSLNLFS